MTATLFGITAAALTVASFLPQAWRIIKTRETTGLVTSMWLLSTSAFALWASYGVIVGSLPIIVPNAICFALAGFILVLKLLPRRRREAVCDALDTTPST